MMDNTKDKLGKKLLLLFPQWLEEMTRAKQAFHDYLQQEGTIMIWGTGQRVSWAASSAFLMIKELQLPKKEENAFQKLIKYLKCKEKLWL